MTAIGDRQQATRFTGPPAPAAVMPVLPRRRRAGLTALGIILVVVGAVVAYLVFSAVGVSRPSLALTRDVPYGAAITAGDLTVVNVNTASGLAPIPAADRSQVIGMHAASDLYAGTLLTRPELTTVTIPAPGQQVLGLELKPGQLPGSVKVGNAILLAIVPPSSLDGIPATPSSVTAITTINATVAAGPVRETDGNVRVDVAVDAADGPTVAAMSAAGRIVIIVTTRS